MSTISLLIAVLAALNIATLTHGHASTAHWTTPLQNTIPQPPTHANPPHHPHPAYSAKQQASPPSRNPPPSPSPSFVIRRSIPGFVRSTTVGATVTVGVTVTIQFSIIVDGVLATDLDDNDTPFVSRIARQTIAQFRALRRNYQGGLNVPFLELVGANLNQTVTVADLVATSRTLFLYRRLTFFARLILGRQPVSRIRISGSTTISGTSFIPQTIFSFIRVANVELIDGSEIQVISANPSDVAFASFDGSGVVSNVTTIQDFKVEKIM